MRQVVAIKNLGKTHTFPKRPLDTMGGHNINILLWLGNYIHIWFGDAQLILLSLLQSHYGKGDNPALF